MIAAGVLDAPLERAYAAVPREAFLGAPPWHAVSAFRGSREVCAQDIERVYEDVLFALAPDRGVNNGSPSLHAAMLHALGPMPGERVLHVGAGTGYYTAILAELAGPSGRVQAIEVDPALAKEAERNLAPWANVEVLRGDGASWPQASAARIYVNFGCARPAAAWIERLAPGGRLVFPLGVPSAPSWSGGPRHTEVGAVLVVERPIVQRGGAGLAARWLSHASFVFAEGTLAGDAADREALARAFGRDGIEFIRSLQWRHPADPARCWFWSPGWSLGFDPVPE
ncbi:MAG: methyltransferase domain-containing protein [Acidisphaera sp.]|nr:methyltransferase domain-containing protein [Acidisphaera sp.]